MIRFPTQLNCNRFQWISNGHIIIIRSSTLTIFSLLSNYSKNRVFLLEYVLSLHSTSSKDVSNDEKREYILFVEMFNYSFK